MTSKEVTDAARDLARGLGIPVYVRDGRIYQHGPGIEFLPPTGAFSREEGRFGKVEETGR